MLYSTLRGVRVSRNSKELANLGVGGDVLTEHDYTLDAVGNRVKVEESWRQLPPLPPGPGPTALPPSRALPAGGAAPAALPPSRTLPSGGQAPAALPTRPLSPSHVGTTKAYEQDRVYRLTEAIGPEGPATYEYDAVGNRVSMTRNGATTTYDYDRADRITRAGTAPHTVNADGNLVAKGSDSLQYDQANRLVSATINGQTTTFAYDGDGKRTRKTAGGSTTDYTYDVAAALPVLLEDGQRKYVWGRGLLYATNPAGTAVASVYQRDGLGTVRALTDGAGALTDVRDTDAFGLPTRSQGPTAQPFGFTGEQRDAETGFVYLRARYYDPGLGRFLQRDPLAGRLSRPITLNRYVYAENNPVTYTDPSGLVTYFVGGVGGSRYEQYDAFKAALESRGVENVTVVSAFDYEAGKPSKWADVAVRDVTGVDPDAQALAQLVLNEREQYAGEPLNFIGYSAGATVVVDAAQILQENGITVDNLVTIGGVSGEPPPENVGDWTRIQGQWDIWSAMPGFPEQDVHLAGTDHYNYFDEEHIDSTANATADGLRD